MKHNLIISVGGILLTFVMSYYGCDNLVPIGKKILNGDALDKNILDKTVFAENGQGGQTASTSQQQNSTNYGQQVAYGQSSPYSQQYTNPNQYPNQYPNQNQYPSQNQYSNQNQAGGSNQYATTSAAPQSSIVMGTFNIRVFGTSKYKDKPAMRVLVDIVRKFDIIAIQEIRAKDQTLIPNFVAMLNADGSRFSHMIGPRQGYTASKEQYVFVWNTRTIRPVQNRWLFPDPKGKFHRTPLIATFECITDPRVTPFRFSLANIHTDPDVATEEVNALADAFARLQGSNVVDDDLIILGDFNASPRQFGRLKQIPGIAAVIPSTYPTNLSRTACYDNIVFDRRFTTEYTRSSGVFDFQKEYNLSKDDAERVSDHFPVWAVFNTAESSSNTNLASPNDPRFSR